MRTTKAFVLISLITILGIYGCKKEEVNPQEFVQNYIIGKWALKYNIRTVTNSTFGDKSDTLVRYNPVDTLVFTADGKVNRVNQTLISTMDYSIDETGENITFKDTTPSTLRLVYVRSSRLIIGTEVSSIVNGKTVKTIVADHYIR